MPSWLDSPSAPDSSVGQGSVLLRQRGWSIALIERIDPSQIEEAELRAQGSDPAHVRGLGPMGPGDRERNVETGSVALAADVSIEGLGRLPIVASADHANGPVSIQYVIDVRDALLLPGMAHGLERKARREL